MVINVLLLRAHGLYVGFNILCWCLWTSVRFLRG